MALSDFMSLTWLNATTRNDFLKVWRNNAYTASNLLKYLNIKNRTKMQGTGVEWSSNLVKSNGVGVAGGYHTMPVGDGTPVLAKLEPGKYVAQIRISGDEERMNTGNTARMLSILAEKNQVAMDSLLQDQAADLFTGTGTKTRNSITYNNIVGLETAIDDSAAYAGINRSTYVNWRSYVDDTPYQQSDLMDETSPNYIWRVLTNAYVQLDEPPDLVVVNPAVFVLISSALGQKIVYNSTNKAQLGFDSIQLIGAEIIYDKYAPNYTAYLINTKDVLFKTLDGANYELLQDGWQSEIANNIDAKVAYIGWQGQLVVKNPKLHAKITGIGAAGGGSSS